MKQIYTASGPVQAGNGLYIERQADADLLRYCREGRFAFVLSSRQVGKSSLMNNVATALAEDGIESVIVDLQEVGNQATPEQWYQGILTIVEERFGLGVNVNDWWRANANLSESHRFGRFLEEEVLSSRQSPGH